MSEGLITYIIEAGGRGEVEEKQKPHSFGFLQSEVPFAATKYIIKLTNGSKVFSDISAHL